MSQGDSMKPDFSVDELVELIADSELLGRDRHDDPAQHARLKQILGHLDENLRQDIVTRFVSEDSLTKLKLRRFVERYGLTKAEAKLVESLCAGRSSAEHAEAHSISPNTVRTHMQRVREKLGVKRQAEIVRMALE